MPDTPPTSNAKIYPRPDKKAPSPWLIVISLVLVMLISVFAYRAFANRGTASPSQESASAETKSQQRQMPFVDKRP